jgi:hypothetical protein
MAEKIIAREDISRIDFLDIAGSLHLSGWNREEIRIKEIDEKLKYNQKKTILEISSIEDVLITIPHTLEVVIKSVSGDATIKGLRGGLEIKSISGDVIVSDVSSLSAETIAGDLIASRIQGDFQVKSIGGDSLIDNAQGQVELKTVGGDVQLDTIAGGIDIQAGGDASASFHPVPWQAYQLIASGDLSLSIPADTNADLSIESGEKDIRIFPGKLDLTHKEEKLEHTLGEGGPAIFLQAGGQVFIIDDEFTAFTGMKMNLENLGSFAVGFSTDTAEQIRDSLDHLEEDLTESFSSLADSLKDFGLSDEKLKDLGTKIEESSRRAAERAEIAAIKAQAKVEKKIAMARRKAQKAQQKMKEFDLDSFLETRTENKVVSESERKLILEMLQDKKISPEEADELLQALEGKRK